MEAWVWIAAFTVLGSAPEHVRFGAFATRAECEQALEVRRQEMLRNKKEIAGSCYFTKRDLKGITN